MLSGYLALQRPPLFLAEPNATRYKGLPPSSIHPLAREPTHKLGLLTNSWPVNQGWTPTHSPDGIPCYDALPPLL